MKTKKDGTVSIDCTLIAETRMDGFTRYMLRPVNALHSPFIWVDKKDPK